MSAESKMERLLESEGIEFERNVKFNPNEDWTFDFVIYPAIAIDVKGVGYTDDVQKYNASLTQGWRVLRYATGQINHNVIIDISLLWLHSLRHSDSLLSERPRSYKKDKKMEENWKQKREIEKRLVSLGYQGMISGAKLVG